MYDTNVLKSVKIDGSSLKVPAGATVDCGTEIYVIASSVKKNAKKQPVWQIGGSIHLNVKWQCEPKLRMKYPEARNPVRNPISSQEKITYQSSDKKIAAVDSTGKIKGIRPGKATITVKSGTVKVKCTVTVTK